MNIKMSYCGNEPYYSEMYNLVQRSELPNAPNKKQLNRESNYNASWILIKTKEELGLTKARQERNSYNPWAMPFPFYQNDPGEDHRSATYS